MGHEKQMTTCWCFHAKLGAKDRTKTSMGPRLGPSLGTWQDLESHGQVPGKPWKVCQVHAHATPIDTNTPRALLSGSMHHFVVGDKVGVKVRSKFVVWIKVGAIFGNVASCAKFCKILQNFVKVMHMGDQSAPRHSTLFLLGPMDHSGAQRLQPNFS